MPNLYFKLARMLEIGWETSSAGAHLSGIQHSRYRWYKTSIQGNTCGLYKNKVEEKPTNAIQKCVHELAPLSGAHGIENSSGAAWEQTKHV